MHTFRTLIVDQDASARHKITTVLRAKTEIEVIGEYDNGTEAIESINDTQPDLVFMEIELPDINGFDVIDHLAVDRMPLIVFTSSYRDFAVQAFEIEALDYIQKPFDSERIEKTFQRLGNRYTDRSADAIGTLVPNHQPSKKLERFIIKQAGEYHLVRAEDIVWIEADGNYSRIMTGEKKFMVRYTLSGFEEQLDEERFYRISRSQIVNLDYVVKIKDHIYGNYIVELQDGISLKMSKNYKQLLEVLKNF